MEALHAQDPAKGGRHRGGVSTVITLRPLPEISCWGEKDQDWNPGPLTSHPSLFPLSPLFPASNVGCLLPQVSPASSRPSSVFPHYFYMRSRLKTFSINFNELVRNFYSGNFFFSFLQKNQITANTSSEGCLGEQPFFKRRVHEVTGTADSLCSVTIHAKLNMECQEILTVHHVPETNFASGLLRCAHFV